MIDPRPPSTAAMGQARTFLFVPGNRPDRFDKAMAAGADVVILDLEDAVGSNDKVAARDAVVRWLRPGRSATVRINPVDSRWFDQDLALCGRSEVTAIVVPRAEPGPGLTRAAALRPTLAMVETAVGVAGLAAVAATPGVVRLTVGAIDLALDLDVADAAMLNPVLLQLVIASRASGLAPPVAPVTPEIGNDERLRSIAARQRAMGFAGKLCIHPGQIGPIAAGLAPSPRALSQARRVLAAAKRSGGSATTLDGRLIDRPAIDRARRLLEAAGAAAR